MEDITPRFGISKSRAPNLLRILRFLVRWPDKENILRKLPSVFKHGVYSKSRVIIDCTEMFIERARNLTLRATPWSSYKHHNTIKVLVGITPNSVISFVSRAFFWGGGGSVSDKVITQRSGFLDLLERDDLILADRGFLIEEDLASHGARISIPAFTRGKTQLCALDVERTRRLARVRIHVERAMERLKNFPVISSVLHMALVPHTDNIVMVCSALLNLQLRFAKC